MGSVPGGGRVFGWIATALLALDTVLLGRMVYDLGRLHVALAAGMAIFFLAYLAVAAPNVLGLARGAAPGVPIPGGRRWALALAVPAALAASVLDCMGLELTGCTPTCGALTQGVAPAVAALTAAFALTRARAWMAAAALVALGLLVPNCICRNPVNRGWIDLLGRSPACYAASVGVFLVAGSALVSGRRVAAAIAVAWTFVVAMLLFWIGHHYFRIPW